MGWIPVPDGAAEGGLPNPYTIILIPDTQKITNDDTRNLNFQAAADWIVAEAETRNIQLVLHLGDVVDNATTAQFDRAAGPMGTIWNAGVPLLAAIGNHDYDGGSPNEHVDTTQWNSYFGTDKYTGRTWWDGAFRESGKSENFYTRLELGGRPTIVFALELWPRDATMAWFDTVAGAHPLHDIIVNTHGNIDASGEHATGHSYSLGTDFNTGDEMWANHFSKHRNMVAVFNGHFIGGGHLSSRVDEGDNGNLVYQQFTNWQHAANGGEGRIAVLTVNPFTGWVTMETYNPATPGFETTWDAEFQLFQFTGTAAHSHNDLYYTEAEVDALVAGVEAGGGEILISDTPSTPLVFADLLQNEAQDDLVYSD
jgi:hypothetical protein